MVNGAAEQETRAGKWTRSGDSDCGLQTAYQQARSNNFSVLGACEWLHSRVALASRTRLKIAFAYSRKVLSTHVEVRIVSLE